MKLEINSQISKHESKPVSIDSYTSKFLGNSGYYASVHGFHFSGMENEGFCLREANCDTHVEKM